jgi:death on curing protein
VTLRYLDLADLLVIAEAVLETPAEKIVYASRLTLAESAVHASAASFGGVDFYPDLASKAAVLCIHLVKNHPFPDGKQARRLPGHDRVRRAQWARMDAAARR